LFSKYSPEKPAKKHEKHWKKKNRHTKTKAFGKHVCGEKAEIKSRLKTVILGGCCLCTEKILLT